MFIQLLLGFSHTHILKLEFNTTICCGTVQIRCHNIAIFFFALFLVPWIWNFCLEIWNTTKYSKTCLKRPLKKRPKLFFKTDNRLMQVKSITILSTFINLPFAIKTFVLFGRIRQVLLYCSSKWKKNCAVEESHGHFQIFCPMVGKKFSEWACKQSLEYPW